MRQDIAELRRGRYGVGGLLDDPLDRRDRPLRFSLPRRSAWALGAGALLAALLLYVAGFLSGALWLDTVSETRAASALSQNSAPAVGTIAAFQRVAPRDEDMKPIRPSRADPSPPLAPALLPVGFAVQFGIYRHQANAQAVRGRLAGSGISEVRVELEAGGGGANVYAVRAGRFVTREAADAAQKRFAAEHGFEGFVVEDSHRLVGVGG